jgi:hypothetical protein
MKMKGVILKALICAVSLATEWTADCNLYGKSGLAESTEYTGITNKSSSKSDPRIEYGISKLREQLKLLELKAIVTEIPDEGVNISSRYLVGIKNSAWVAKLLSSDELAILPRN